MDGGQQSHYGALAVNRRWVPSYGDYGLRIHGADDANDVYLPANSAEDYVDPGGAVRAADVERDVTAPSERHLLAATKHAADVRIAEPAGWPRLRCESTSFVEAIIPSLRRLK